MRAADVDGVMIPGGYAADRIRLRHAMVDLVRDAVEAGKPVAAIDHGAVGVHQRPVLSGRLLTCWPSIAVDAKNAGARYVDRPVVEDGNVITSRKSDDLPFLTDGAHPPADRPSAADRRRRGRWRCAASRRRT